MDEQTVKEVGWEPVLQVLLRRAADLGEELREWAVRADGDGQKETARHLRRAVERVAQAQANISGAWPAPAGERA